MEKYSAPRSGRGGRRFKSCHSDHLVPDIDPETGENLHSQTAQRFWDKVQISADFECWNWTGALNEKGYGRFQREGAHRVAHRLANGPIPSGLMVRHRCDNPQCCNPLHLELGTARSNAHDAMRRDRVLRGERNARSKLTPETVAYIRANPENLGATAMANRVGVSKATVSLIRSGKRWAHV